MSIQPQFNMEKQDRSQALRLVGLAFGVLVVMFWLVFVLRYKDRFEQDIRGKLSAPLEALRGNTPDLGIVSQYGRDVRLAGTVASSEAGEAILQELNEQNAAGTLFGLRSIQADWTVDPKAGPSRISDPPSAAPDSRHAVETNNSLPEPDLDALRRAENEKLRNLLHEATVYFDRGKVSVPPRHQSVLQSAANELVRRIDLVQIQVLGFADPSGDAAANQTLSLRRANAVAEILVKAGVARERMEIRGVGEVELIRAGTDPSMSRRVELRIDPNTP